MKKAFIVFALAMVAISASAQVDTLRYCREGKTFVQRVNAPSKSDTPTTYVWRDAKGNEHPIILHTYAKGEKAGRTTAYVIRVSAKSGKEYKYYLPDGERIAAEILNDNEEPFEILR